MGDSVVMSEPGVDLLNLVAETGPLNECIAASICSRVAKALVDHLAAAGADSLRGLLRGFPDNVLMQEDGTIVLSTGA